MSLSFSEAKTKKCICKNIFGMDMLDLKCPDHGHGSKFMSDIK